MNADNGNLYTKNDLFNIFNDIIVTEFDNRELIRSLNTLFSNKGLNQEKVGALFGQTLSLNDLNKIELIAFTKGCVDFLHLHKKIKLGKFFSIADLNDFTLYKGNGEEIIKQIVFENILQIDDSTFLGRITYKQIYEYIANGLIRYNKESQREPVLKKLGTKAGYVTDININLSNAYEIAELMYNGDYEENQIILNIRLIDENITPDYTFIPKFQNVLGDLIITPNTGFESDNFTIVEILDGYHRIVGAIEAVQKKFKEDGAWLEGGLDVRIVVKDIDEAKRVVRQTFKRSDTNEEYLKSFDVDDYTKFIDSIISYSQILKQNVANTYVDYMVKNTLTYKTILVAIVRECTDIDVSSISMKKKGAKAIAENIDNIVLYLAEIYFDNDIKKMKKESGLLEANIIAGYLILAHEMKKRDTDDFEGMVEYIYNIPTDVINDLNHINNNHNNEYYARKIYNVFKHIPTEVLQ